MVEYLSQYPHYLRRLFQPSKPVRHQQTCQVCGRRLVNLYRKDGAWKCKRCWDESAQREEGQDERV